MIEIKNNDTMNENIDEYKILKYNTIHIYTYTLKLDMYN